MPFNIELPDGRIIEGIPDGTTKAQIASKFNLPLNQPSKLESAARGAYQGLSANLGDELMGIGGGIVGTAADLYYGNGFNPIANYQAATTSARGQNKAAQEANPWTYGLSEVAGSIPTTAKAISVLPSKFVTANTVLGSAGKAAGVGAGIGGAYGFGAGEGVKGSLEGAAIGGAIGGLTGGILDAGISGVTGRYKPTITTSPILSEQGVIPLTRGQLTGEDAILQKEMDLRKLKTPSGQLLQGFENQVQKPAALDYLKQQFNMPETSYQNLMGELQTGIQSKAGQVKQTAVDLRRASEGEMAATLPKNEFDKMINQIGNALNDFDATDVQQTFKNIKTNAIKNISNNADSNYLASVEKIKNENLVRTSLGQTPLPIPAPEQSVRLADIFKAQKRLSQQKNMVGAKSAAASKASQIIDDNLNQLVENKLITGDVEALKNFQKSVPAFKKFYQNYQDTPSSVFNKVATNPEALSPDELFNTVYGKSLGGSASGRLFAEQVKKTLGEGANEKLQQGFVDALVKKSSNDLGEVNLNTMKRQLNNFLSNEQFAKTIMPQEKLVALKNLRADLVKATRSPQGYKDSGTAYNMERIKGLLGFGGIKGDILKSIVNRTQNAKQLKFAKEAVNTQQIQAAPMQNIYSNTLGVTARPATANVQEILNR